MTFTRLDCRDVRLKNHTRFVKLKPNPLVGATLPLQNKSHVGRSRQIDEQDRTTGMSPRHTEVSVPLRFPT